jgi:putative transcriptional regulator
MTITHHASDELLLAYAAGHLSPAPALVLASHVAMSKASEARLADYQALGGAVLDTEPLADVSPDLFEKMLSRLEETTPEEHIRIRQDHRVLDLDVELPAPLKERKIGKWRWIAPGIRFANVDVPEDPKFKVVLLRVAAGKALPPHGHAGTELTLVLKGYFSDENARYGPGDIEEEDQQSDHQPKVDAGSECICLAAIEGSMRPHNWIVRMMQPLFGF